MTYIAKAMDKTRRLDGVAARMERASADDASQANAGGPELVVIPGARSGKSPTPLPPMARPGRARKPDESESLESYGAAEESPAMERPWWKEPLLWTAVALGLSAVLFGFLFTPVRSPDPVESMTAMPAAVAPAESAGTSAAEEAPAPVTVSGGRNPVVVRVEIDSGSGEVRFDGGGSVAVTPPAPAAPTPPPVFYDPLPMLELPPPPLFESSDVAPRSSSSSRSSSTPRAASIDDYVLEGVFWTEDSPAAIINDEIVEVGGRVGSLRVIGIERTHVVVELNGRTHDLR
jgi:hypothetical protein